MIEEVGTKFTVVDHGMCCGHDVSHISAEHDQFFFLSAIGRDSLASRSNRTQRADKMLHILSFLPWQTEQIHLYHDGVPHLSQETFSVRWQVIAMTIIGPFDRDKYLSRPFMALIFSHIDISIK